MHLRLLPLALASAFPATSLAGNVFRQSTPGEHLLLGTSDEHRPLLRTKLAGIRVEAPLSLAARETFFLAVPVDPTGSELTPEAELDLRARLGLRLDSMDSFGLLLFGAELEYDALTGPVAGGDDGSVEAVSPPLSGKSGSALRRAFGHLSFGPFLTLGGGYTVSHWGLGLVANDGAHGFTPGSGQFSDPRDGDRVLRGQVATGPYTSHRLVISGAYDVVQDDDVKLEGDTATQMSLAAVLGHDRPNRFGVYVAKRVQEADDGDETRVTVFDLHARAETRKTSKIRAFVEAEAAFVTGETDLGPSAEFPVHDVRQLGIAGRAGFFRGQLGGVADLIYASGDRNLDDRDQNAFRADPNLEQGLLLFRHVIAAQSARGPIRAADPELVGFPAEDLDRLPTRGQVTNAVTFFPRAVFRAADGLEIYGGPLFAWAQGALIDARETRLAGGDPRNALGGRPDDFLGTELDVGLRYTVLLFGSRFSIGMEGGLFVPGGAFDSDGDAKLEPIGGGRLMTQWEL